MIGNDPNNGEGADTEKRLFEIGAELRPLCSEVLVDLISNCGGASFLMDITL